MRDRLEEIRLDLETGRDTSHDQQWWMVDEIDRLRAGVREALGRYQVTHCHSALREAVPDDVLRQWVDDDA
jgi:hypothetical protein